MTDRATRAPIVDAHLDMAYNVLAGRDYDLTPADIRAVEGPSAQKCMVTLSELERGSVAVAFGTLFTGTSRYDADGQGIYPEPPEDTARKQHDIYLAWEAEQKIRIIRDGAALTAHLDAWKQDGKLGVVLLIEGGDSITSPDALPEWFEAGVRIIGPAWSKTRYCGGTRRPGGLTSPGKDLLNGMRELGIVLDASHLAEEAFWDAVELGPGRMIATHSNARELVPGGRLLTGDRQLSDEMIGAIGDLDGVVGINLFNGFLFPDWEAVILGRILPQALRGPITDVPVNAVTLDAVGAHAKHIADLVGWHRVGIGSDLDGGLGADETPAELDTIADLHRVADVVPPEARTGVLGENWLRFLANALP